MKRNSAKVVHSGQPVSWLGANFWSRSGGPLMWRSYDPGLVRQELGVLAEHGLGMTRSFFYWPDFMPEPDRIDEAMAARFADFLDAHSGAGMTTVPTFLVGHMSGENWDPPWRGDRDLYRDVWLVARQAWFAGEMVSRFGGHPAVCGWLVSNEMPLYGGEAPAEVVASWAQIIRDAVRAAGGRQPLSLGDGAWGIEVTGRDNGFSVATSVELCDFLGPHCYPVGDDVARQHYAAAWQCELASTFGAPVVLEEFGVSSDFASDASAAVYYRQVLHNSLLAGATGWIGWCNSDYDNLAEQDPYRHHAFEMHFGLTGNAGTPKPQLLEMRAFADLLAAVDARRCERAETDAALVVSSFLDTAYPFTSPDDRSCLHDTLRQAYVSARLADLPVALTREKDGLADDARLYLIPSAKQLLAPTWRRLEQLAAGGATVYVSYSPGPSQSHAGPWYGWLDEIFGVKQQLRPGLAEPIEDPEVTFTFSTGFGPLRQGDRLAFRTAGNGPGTSYLPVRPAAAEVVAADAHGRPALLSRAVGTGSMILCTYPVEYLASVTPRVNPEQTSALYAALAEVAGVRRMVTVPDPRVAADVLVRPDGARFAWLVSQADEAVEVRPRPAAGLRLTRLDGAPAGGGVALDPFGVVVLRLVAAGPTATD